MTRGPTAGLGLKPQHYAAVHDATAVGLWVEVHPENYMHCGGARTAWLSAIAERHPLSLHGVGLSLAGDADPDPDHLAALRALADRFAPFAISEHLAWSRAGTVYHPDLLPFPRTGAALNRIAANVGRTQDALSRQLLIENPSLYVPLAGHDMSETEFLAELVARTGCGLLVDVNNVHVSMHNLCPENAGAAARAYLDALPADAIGEIHLAGHDPDPQLGAALLIDTHGAAVAAEVWTLFEHLIDRIGPRLTLIERDANIPEFAELLAERDHAHALLMARALVDA